MSEGAAPVLSGKSEGGGEGEGSAGGEVAWHDSLSSTFRNNEFVTGYSNDASGLDKFVKTAVSAQSMIGKRQEASGIMIPGEDATIEDYVRFYEQLGRPGSPDEYELSVEGFSPDTPRNEKSEKHLIKSMYDAGASKKQANRVWDDFVAEQNQIWEGVKSLRTNNERANAADLNTAFGSMKDTKISLANEGFNAAFGENAGAIADLILVDGTRFGDRPDVVKAMANHGVTLAEAELIQGSQHGLDISPGEAAQEKKNLLGDPAFMKAWMTSSDPGHQSAVDKMNRLTETMHG